MDIEIQFENYLSNLNQLKTGRLSIGASNVFASFILPEIITKFTDKYPSIKIRLIEAASAQLEELLFSGTLDFVLDNYPLDEAIYQKHLFCSENLILAVPPNLSANTRALPYQLSINDIHHEKHLDPLTKSVPLSIFAHEPFIFLRSGNDTRIRSDKIFKKNQLIPKIILELDQLATAYNVACYGMGATIISDTLVKKANGNSTMLYYKIDSPYTFRNVFFYNKQNKYITRTMEEFIKLAQNANINTMHIL
nr:LysR family transcriptional regulator substrate-binding protein [Pectinatus haikarae]